MSTTQKKPKARQMWAYSHTDGSLATLATGKRGPGFIRIPVAVLDVSDPDALIEVAAKAINDDERSYVCGASCEDNARAALTALGVLPKRRGK